uniref:Uncharacterized protein n=1 Tax=Anguilla anguilla TaxID=7936 RepID=A0A0E9WQ66_ANGAN
MEEPRDLKDFLSILVGVVRTKTGSFFSTLALVPFSFLLLLMLFFLPFELLTVHSVIPAPGFCAASKTLSTKCTHTHNDRRTHYRYINI